MDKPQRKNRRFTDPPLPMEDGYSANGTPRKDESWLDAFNRGTREQVNQWIDATKAD